MRQLVLALVLIGSVAHAERRSPLAGQPQIRHRLEMRTLRFEVAPQFVVSTNQDFRHFLGGGLVLQFHLNDWLGVGFQGAFGGGLNSALTDKVLATLPEMESGKQPSRDQFTAHLSSTSLLLSGYLTLTPIVGKVALFGAAFLRYDLYGLVGVGGMSLKNSFNASDAMVSSAEKCMNGDSNWCDPQNAGFKFGGVFGVGVHLFFNDWIGANFELRDYLASTNPGGFDVDGDSKIGGANGNPDSTISNNLFFGMGVSLMFPTTPKISL